MHSLVALAKEAVEAFVLRGEVLCPPEKLGPEMEERAGVFVCLKKYGELRGCIGTFLPSCSNIAEETVRNAVAAAAEDPRFLPVNANELAVLTYSVDVLFPPEKVRDLSDLDHRRYGVIVVCGGRKGLLLPDLEGVDSVEEQLRIARMKAGIGQDEPAEIFRFRVRRYH